MPETCDDLHDFYKQVDIPTPSDEFRAVVVHGDRNEGRPSLLFSTLGLYFSIRLESAAQALAIADALTRAAHASPDPRAALATPPPLTVETLAHPLGCGCPTCVELRRGA